MTFRIELGSTVRDCVTRLEGVVVGRHEYLYGCIRYTVQPVELKDGKPVEEPHKGNETGGPRAEPSRRKDPAR